MVVAHADDLYSLIEIGIGIALDGGSEHLFSPAAAVPWDFGQRRRSFRDHRARDRVAVRDIIAKAFE